MRWNFTSPAVVRVGEKLGSLELVIDDLPGTAPMSVTAKWSLFPWNGDPGSMGYQTATPGTPTQHEDPHTGLNTWSVVLTLAKNLIPGSLDPGLYFLSVRFESGATYEYPIPKRALAVSLEAEFVAAP